MCCFALSLAALGPRFALLMVWIFGDRVELAFDSWIWPLLGLFFAPWTVLMYVLAWGPIDGVSGAGWILVALGIVLDVMTYAARPASSRYRSSY